jgi:membrane associated rhomboid family serine protease
MRTCPRCRRYPLREIHNGAVEIDHCDVCHGSFFDAHTIAPTWGKAANPQYWVEQNFAHWKGNTGLVCPYDDERMDAYKLTWGDSRPVVVDVCPRCSGLWLDEGEGATLKRILDDHDSEREGAQSGSWRTYIFQLFTGLPIEVYNPVRRRPWLLYTLILSIVGAFVWQLWVTAVHGDAGKELVKQFMLVPRELSAGRQWWGLVTHGWLHGGGAHLLGNLYFLWIFGDNIEDRAGRTRFAAVYVAALFGAALAQYFVDMSTPVPMLGASGAISGITGAYLALFPRVRVWVVFFFVRFKVSVAFYFTLWVIVQVVSAYLGAPGVAWYAHLGGFVTGVAFGLWWRRALKKPKKTIVV